MEETNLKEKETEEKMKNTDGNNKEIKVKESNKKKKIIIFITIAINVGILLFLKYGNFISKNINEILNLLNINTNFDYTCCYISFIYGICYYEY